MYYSTHAVIVSCIFKEQISNPSLNTSGFQYLIFLLYLTKGFTIDHEFHLFFVLCFL